jgi:hypothetical protein
MGAILVGVWFGKLFAPEMTATAMSRFSAVETVRAEGIFDKMDLAPTERDFFSKVDISLLKDFGRALAAYPPVEPEELLCPALMVAGTANRLATSKLKDREGDMRVAGVAYRFFEGLDHDQEFSAIESSGRRIALSPHRSRISC